MKILKNAFFMVTKKKLIKITNFSDYSASEKTKIIKQAVRESNRVQKELVDEYDRQFAT